MYQLRNYALYKLDEYQIHFYTHHWRRYNKKPIKKLSNIVTQRQLANEALCGKIDFKLRAKM